MTGALMISGVLHGLSIAYLMSSGDLVWRATGNARWDARFLWLFALLMWLVHFGQDFVKAAA